MGLIKILNTSKQTLHLITQVKDFYIESELETADKIIHFLMPKQNEASVDLKQENYLQTEEHIFVIKEINYKEKDYVEVFGKLDTDDLKSTIIRDYESVRRPLTLVMSDILPGTGWTYEPVDLPNTLRTIRIENKTAYEIIMDAMNLYNYEIEFDTINKRIRVAQQLGANRGSYLHSDLNIKRTEFQSDTYDFRTRLYPYGKDGMTIADVNDGKEYVSNNVYSNKIIEEIWIDNRYTDKESLKADAIARLDKMARPRLSYVVDVVYLTKLNPIYSILDFKLGDTVKIIDKDLELIDSQRVVKLLSYPLAPEKNKVHLGDTQLKFKSSEENVGEIAEKIAGEKIEIVRTELMEEIERTNALIGSAEKGYIVTRRDANGVAYEQLIMDTDDVATASKIWRWNMHGLAYSSTGYNGEYRTAITAEGRISADFVTTGTLNAALIKAGLLMSVDGSSWIDMDNGSFNFKDALKWDSSKNKLILGSNTEISWDYIADAPTIPTSAEDIGARPNTWMPTPGEIGARPDNWMPTASQVGARPSNWTPTAAEVGAKANTWFPSWNEVTGKPNIQPLPPYITSTAITATTIESPSIYAGTINAAAITGSTIGGGVIVGSLFKTGVNGKRLEINSLGLKSYGAENNLSGVSMSPAESFGKMEFYNPMSLSTTTSSFSKGHRAYTAPTISNGVASSRTFVYIHPTKSSIKPPNTTYWTELDIHIYGLPEEVKEQLGTIYNNFSAGRTYRYGDAISIAQLVGGKVRLTVYKFIGPTGYGAPAPQPPPNTTFWEYLGEFESAPPSTKEADYGEIVNEQMKHLVTKTSVGIKTYFRDIHLHADGMFKAGAPDNRVQMSGDILMTSRYGKVKAMSQSGTEILSEKDILISTDYNLANPGGMNDNGGHIILNPQKGAHSSGEVRLLGSQTIRSMYNGVSHDMYLRAGNADRGTLHLRASNVALNGSNIHTSDIKLKENIVDINSTLLDIADDIKLTDYNFKATPEKKHIGTIAQWVEESFNKHNVDPGEYDIVSTITDETGEETKYVNYIELMMLKIAALERRIAELEQ